MNKEQAKKAASVMLAWADGKTIECKRKDGESWGHDSTGTMSLAWDWSTFDTGTMSLAWDWSTFDYRVKPEPKLRPWTADEVPLGAWMRFKRNPQDRVLIGWVSVQADRDLWLGEREHSIDGGKTWLPCGVEEAKP